LATCITGRIPTRGQTRRPRGRPRGVVQLPVEVVKDIDVRTSESERGGIPKPRWPDSASGVRVTSPTEYVFSGISLLEKLLH
jgi:hypothetical protein